MTRRKVTNIAHSVHQRLLAQAQKSNRPFNELLQHYAIERFLYRLGRSSHSEELLLKGALLLRVWKLPITRPTMDIDVLCRGAGTADALVAILQECMTLTVDDDGMQYNPNSIATESITLDADYQGWHIRFDASLGNARVPMQVDVGLGDAVYPAPIWIEYPVLLDHPPPRLLAYTPDNAIAEKYQAMVELDMANSRMKDFHDIWTLAGNLAFDGERLSEAIRRTFERRKTIVPKSISTAFTPRFYEDRSKQMQWQAFLRKARLPSSAGSLADVVVSIRDFLVPPTEALIEGKPFLSKWSPGGPWA